MQMKKLPRKVVILDKAKKNLTAKEGILTTKKGELEKIIAATEKRRKTFQ